MASMLLLAAAWTQSDRIRWAGMIAVLMLLCSDFLHYLYIYSNNHPTRPRCYYCNSTRKAEARSVVTLHACMRACVDFSRPRCTLHVGRMCAVAAGSQTN